MCHLFSTKLIFQQRSRILSILWFLFLLQTLATIWTNRDASLFANSINSISSPFFKPQKKTNNFQSKFQMLRLSQANKLCDVYLFQKSPFFATLYGSGNDSVTRPIFFLNFILKFEWAGQIAETTEKCTCDYRNQSLSNWFNVKIKWTKKKYAFNTLLGIR